MFCVVLGLFNRHSAFKHIGFGDGVVFDFEGFDLKGGKGGVECEVEDRKRDMRRRFDALRFKDAEDINGGVALALLERAEGYVLLVDLDESLRFLALA